MANPIIFILDPYHTDAVRVVQESASVDVVIRKEQPNRIWQDEATGLMIRSETRITASDFARAKKLKVIVKQGVGVDNIDVEAAKEHGVIVCNTPALNSEAVAELTLSLALCISRRVVEFDRRIRRGEVLIRSQVMGRSLFQKTIGIIGMGNIGKVVAQKWLAAMQGQVFAYDPFALPNAWDEIPHCRIHALDDLLKPADVISLHVPLTEDTRNMIGEHEFEMMKDSAILLNCARGGVVNETALLDALKSKKIYGAALDAVEVEPPTSETYGALLENENLIITPHVGGNTVENQIKSGIAVAETMLAVLDGKEVCNRIV